MDVLSFHLSYINWWAVILATLASFVVGSVWYAPPVFGKIWMKANGIKPKDAKNVDMVQTFTITTLLNFVMVVGLATLMCALALKTLRQGAMFGALVALVFVVTTRGVHMLFERKAGVTLFVINAGYDIVFLTLAGAILGAW